jgi:hypothetical protein
LELVGFAHVEQREVIEPSRHLVGVNLTDLGLGGVQ